MTPIEQITKLYERLYGSKPSDLWLCAFFSASEKDREWIIADFEYRIGEKQNG